MAGNTTRLHPASNEGRITELDERVTSLTSLVATTINAVSQISARIETVEPLPKSPPEPLTSEEIYPDASDRPPQLSRAFVLLYESEDFLGRALEAIRSGSEMESDGEVMNFGALLPELFTIRESIGDGFALCVSAMFQANYNRKGLPLNETQILALIRVVRLTRKEIFCSIEAAIDVIEALTEAGLDVEPAAVAVIGEALSD
jgi:hypothetical protein